MLDLPEQFLTLQTPRLILRKMGLEDAEDIFAYASDPQTTAYTLWDYHRSIDDTYDYLHNFVWEIYRSGKGMCWGIVEKESNQLIGSCSLHLTPSHRRAEMGYVLGREYWGQGLMTEASKAAIAFGFHMMFLLRIQAFCVVENVGSARVLEKSGMLFEGILHNYVFTKNRSWDVKMYAVTQPQNIFL
ncbi:GNAT family N-acetyltransferase [Pseudanabaena sp. FACHB-1998]|uniref:GNAT family N-acetyltransferase n=1 Tax=Pseudanabaena sp. FACHB-1998 TaxID=2692858 RepID=UPI001680ED0B|nr:GNAT family N-acetyltransferase [Pseudanabaena sp. FACHB-1998]MBD2178325.1 GNAT family N-acetyltransferase [Pseudanabaena sp. FACHB-1998]